MFPLLWWASGFGADAFVYGAAVVIVPPIDNSRRWTLTPVYTGAPFTLLPASV